jgi:hypothetical protein
MDGIGKIKITKEDKATKGNMNTCVGKMLSLREIHANRACVECKKSLISGSIQPIPAET